MHIIICTRTYVPVMSKLHVLIQCDVHVRMGSKQLKYAPYDVFRCTQSIENGLKFVVEPHENLIIY